MRGGDAMDHPGDAAEHPVILFDGVCHLCSGSVRFIIKRDPRGYFRFAPLQSALGQSYVRERGLASVDSIVLVQGERCYIKSGAALRICRRLRGAWSWLFVLIVVPAPIRDAIYEYVAKNRYRWFGRKEACMMPTPDIRGRFLQ